MTEYLYRVERRSQVVYCDGHTDGWGEWEPLFFEDGVPDDNAAFDRRQRAEEERDEFTYTIKSDDPDEIRRASNIMKANRLQEYRVTRRPVGEWEPVLRFEDLLDENLGR